MAIGKRYHENLL